MNMRDSPRYPYTYACDWIREAGLAKSRSDASLWVENEARRRGVEKESLCKILAEQYIAYYDTISNANRVRDDVFERLKSGY